MVTIYFRFFWQHGEDEKTLREYMKVIDESNMKAVCVESRPHPDFCGPKWWADMDVVLDEARKRDMKVWILDDSHFPTGFANGAMADQPDERCRQSICCRVYHCNDVKELHIEKEKLLHPDEFEPTQIEAFIGEKTPRKFNDDKLFGLIAVCMEHEDDVKKATVKIDLMSQIMDNGLHWKVPEGKWNVYVLHLSRNMGHHRSYINMMDKASCKVLIDAVYEPHYARYKDDFGKTIAGFFSDEPELGNGHLYDHNTKLGTNLDFPWSRELEERLKNTLGQDYRSKLPFLWEEDVDENEKAKVRYAYMDGVTRLVEEDFSKQIGDWCRAHGVKYIGHLIEDNNQHARTGSSLGHFYRGLAGQDMSGIDDIGGQVLPQGEEVNYDNGTFKTRNGEFLHYMLGKLGSSAAAIERLKNGNSMCEIFGAYGWSEGVRLEKYLVDHFMVRGINHFVPHAFSPKEFPDPDCPPHFYAHGHNPQYRHFGRLMAYTNRVCELISGGRHVAPVAVLYHGEGEWTGTCMFSHEIGHVLADAQIDYDYIPQDVFSSTKQFQTVVEHGALKINTQEYKALVVPTIQYVTKAFAAYVNKLVQADIPVFFVNDLPEGICDAEDAAKIQELLHNIKQCEIVKKEDIISILMNKNLNEITITPADNRIRYYHYEHKDGSGVYLFVNEGTQLYQGKIALADRRKCYYYNAWDNCLEDAMYDGMLLDIEIAPLKSVIVVFDAVLTDVKEVAAYLRPAVKADGNELNFKEEWKRSFCESKAYPNFNEAKKVILPDQLADEEPEFSGFVRYENTFTISKRQKVVLEITDAHEGVEVLINGESQGIQIVPPYRYNVTSAVHLGDNQIVIEVATTLERATAKFPTLFGQKAEPTAFSGITGDVKLYLN